MAKGKRDLLTFVLALLAYKKAGQGGSGEGGGTTDHRDLTHKDSADQHSIGAITGLTDALAARPTPNSYTGTSGAEVKMDSNGKLWVETDTAPTENSTKPIQSGAVLTAISTAISTAIGDIDELVGSGVV